MSDEPVRLELSIDSVDDATIESVIAALGNVEVARNRPARLPDPLTVLTIAGTAVALVNELLTLRDRLIAGRSAPDVVVRNRRGDAVILSEATLDDLTALSPDE
jgi:hypothetical protein